MNVDDETHPYLEFSFYFLFFIFNLPLPMALKRVVAYALSSLRACWAPMSPPELWAWQSPAGLLIVRARLELHTEPSRAISKARLGSVWQTN